MMGLLLALADVAVTMVGEKGVVGDDLSAGLARGLDLSRRLSAGARTALRRLAPGASDADRCCYQLGGNR